MAEKKKILVMVASPKRERSGTLIPTKAFVEGLEQNGDYETEYIFIDKMNMSIRQNLIASRRKLFSSRLEKKYFKPACDYWDTYYLYFNQF